MSVKILNVSAMCGFRREQKKEVRKLCILSANCFWMSECVVSEEKEEVRKLCNIGIKLHWYRIGPSLDSDSSEEDSETDSGNRMKVGMM